MQDLIDALIIFRKYGNPQFPTHCEHDVLTICVDPAVVSEEDKVGLDKLGFIVDASSDAFISYRFGSA